MAARKRASTSTKRKKAVTTSSSAKKPTVSKARIPRTAAQTRQRNTGVRNKQRLAAPKLARYVATLQAKAKAGKLSAGDAAKLKTYSTRLAGYQKNISAGNASVARAGVRAKARSVSGGTGKKPLSAKQKAALDKARKASARKRAAMKRG